MSLHTPPEDCTGPASTRRRASAPNDSAGARGRLRAVRDAAGAILGTILGISPHVLHHVSLLAGAALITGASGVALFVLGPAISGTEDPAPTSPSIPGPTAPSPTGDHSDHHGQAPR